MGNPHYHWKQSLTTSDDLDEYRIKLTSGWARALDDAAAPSTQLNKIVSDFLMALRTVEITASMPYQLVTQFKHFVDGYTKKDTREPASKTAAKLIATKLVRELDIDDADLRHQLAVKCLELGAQVESVRPQDTPAFSLEDIWQNYYRDKGFRMSLWESQRLGLISAYNCYESFLIRCIRVGLGNSFRRRSDERFAKTIVSVFGQSACDTCWSAQTIQLYREARNAITHAGGRETEKLTKLGHQFKLEDEVIQIMPRHLKELLRTIEVGADELVASALLHPRFRNKQKTAKK